MANNNSQEPLPFLVRKTVIGGGITHAALVAGRSISQFVYNNVTPLLAAGIDFIHIIPEVIFAPFFMGAKLLSHTGLLLGRGAIAAAVGAAKYINSHLPENGKLKQRFAAPLDWFIKRGEELKTAFKNAHRWVRDNISPKALGEWVSRNFKKAEIGLFRFGANRHPLAAAGVMLGIIGVVAPITMFGGILTHVLSFHLLTGGPAGYAAFLGANAAATFLPKFKLFLAPLYMGCALSMSKSPLGRKALRWFDHVYPLNIFKDANQSFNGIAHSLTKGKLGFMQYLQPMPWKEKWQQRLAIGTAVVAAVSVSPLFALGAAAVIATPIAFKAAKDKVAAFLSEKIYGDKPAQHKDASEKLGGLVTHTIETYTFPYYYKKDPSLFKNAPPELMKYLLPAAEAQTADTAASTEAKPATAPASEQAAENVVALNPKRTSLLRSWAASANAAVKRVWHALPKTAAELGNETRAAVRSIGFYTTGTIIAAPFAALGGAAAYTLTHAPSAFMVGKPLQALLTTFVEHGGEHFAHSVGNLVAGTLAIPGIIGGYMGGSSLARNTTRTALFSKTSRETCLTTQAAKNAEARLISDGAVTGLVAAGVLFITGSLPIAATIWGTSAVISMVRNHTGMKEPGSATRPTGTPTPLPANAPQAA